MKYFLLPLYLCFLFGKEQPQYIDGVAAVVEEHIILKSDLAQMVNMAAVQSGIDPSKDQSSFFSIALANLSLNGLSSSTIIRDLLANSLIFLSVISGFMKCIWLLVKIFQYLLFTLLY